MVPFKQRFCHGCLLVVTGYKMVLKDLVAEHLIRITLQGQDDNAQAHEQFC